MFLTKRQSKSSNNKMQCVSASHFQNFGIWEIKLFVQMKGFCLIFFILSFVKRIVKVEWYALINHWANFNQTLPQTSGKENFYWLKRMCVSFNCRKYRNSNNSVESENLIKTTEPIFLDNFFPHRNNHLPFSNIVGEMFPQLDKGSYNLIKFKISLASGLGSESDKFMICLRLFSQAYNLLDYHKLHVYMFMQRRVNIHVLMVFILFSCGV